MWLATISQPRSAPPGKVEQLLHPLYQRQWVDPFTQTVGVAAIGKAHADGGNVTAEGHIGICAADARISALLDAYLLQNWWRRLVRADAERGARLRADRRSVQGLKSGRRRCHRGAPARGVLRSFLSARPARRASGGDSLRRSNSIHASWAMVLTEVPPPMRPILKVVRGVCGSGSFSDFFGQRVPGREQRWLRRNHPNCGPPARRRMCDSGARRGPGGRCGPTPFLRARSQRPRAPRPLAGRICAANCPVRLPLIQPIYDAAHAAQVAHALLPSSWRPARCRRAAGRVASGFRPAMRRPATPVELSPMPGPRRKSIVQAA